MKNCLLILVVLFSWVGVSLGQSEPSLEDSIWRALQAEVNSLEHQMLNWSHLGDAWLTIKAQADSLQSETEGLDSALVAVDQKLEWLLNEVGQVEREDCWSLESRLNSMVDRSAGFDSILVNVQSRLDVSAEPAMGIATDSPSSSGAYIGCLFAVLVGLLAFAFGRRKGQESASVLISKPLAEDDSDEGRASDSSTEESESFPEEKEVNHSLVLKVADELNIMEGNLSEMDASVRGHKQLLRSIKHIRTNMKANDYELVELLRQPYYTGMKTQGVTHKVDASIPKGGAVISRVLRPEVRFKGEIIQYCKIEVSRAEPE